MTDHVIKGHLGVSKAGYQAKDVTILKALWKWSSKILYRYTLLAYGGASRLCKQRAGASLKKRLQSALKSCARGWLESFFKKNGKGDRIQKAFVIVFK